MNKLLCKKFCNGIEEQGNGLFYHFSARYIYITLQIIPCESFKTLFTEYLRTEMYSILLQVNLEQPTVDVGVSPRKLNSGLDMSCLLISAQRNFRTLHLEPVTSMFVLMAFIQRREHEQNDTLRTSIFIFT